MADLENLNNKENLNEAPLNTTFPETNERLEKDPELEEARKIIEEWWDTKNIKKLNPELVELLAMQYAKKGIRLKQDGQYDNAFLSLDGLKSINKETAEALSYYEWDNLELSWMTQISTWVAEALWRAKCLNLTLDGLVDISPEVAKNLSQYWGIRLNLNGLKKISQAVATELSAFKWKPDQIIKRNNTIVMERYKGVLVLEWVESIDATVANELSKTLADLRLWLTSLDKETAKALAKYKWQEIRLRKLKNIDKDTAKELAPIIKKLQVSPEIEAMIVPFVGLKSEEKQENKLEEPKKKKKKKSGTIY